MTLEIADKIGSMIAWPIKAFNLWQRRRAVDTYMKTLEHCGAAARNIGATPAKVENMIFGNNRAYKA